MNIDTIKECLPDSAKDLRINLGNVLKAESLTPAQAYGAALASALASRSPDLVEAFRMAASEHLDASGLAAVESASALMAMNNIYYRFTHLVSDSEFGTMPARLRMQAMSNHGASSVDFELWSIAVSAINGCGKCLDSHVAKAIGDAVTKVMVQDVVRIASVVFAVAVTLDSAKASRGA
jgi:alkyl hydroperoxide reductase subunit D